MDKVEWRLGRDYLRRGSSSSDDDFVACGSYDEMLEN